MATNYTLETQVERLRDRAVDLFTEIENNTPDLNFIQGELEFISARASVLAETASIMDAALEKIS